MKIEEMSFKDIFLTIFYSMAILSFLDLATTYCGVCVLGGVELNLAGIKLASKHGFLFLIPIILTPYIILAMILAFALKRYSKYEIAKIMLTILWAYLLLEYAKTVVFNTVGLLQATGIPVKQEQIIPVSEERLERAKEVFEPLREDFCRLI